MTKRSMTSKPKKSKYMVPITVDEHNTTLELPNYVWECIVDSLDKCDWRETAAHIRYKLDTAHSTVGGQGC